MTAPCAAPLLLLFAQATAAAGPAVPYRVGPGDVLEVSVDGRPDLSRLPTVQTTGRVWLPGAGEVEVRGLTADEIAARVAPLLAGEDLAVAPGERPRAGVPQPVRVGAGRARPPGAEAPAQRLAPRRRAARRGWLPGRRVRAR